MIGKAVLIGACISIPNLVIYEKYRSDTGAWRQALCRWSTAFLWGLFVDLASYPAYWCSSRLCDWIGLVGMNREEAMILDAVREASLVGSSVFGLFEALKVLGGSGLMGLSSAHKTILFFVGFMLYGEWAHDSIGGDVTIVSGLWITIVVAYYVFGIVRESLVNRDEGGLTESLRFFEFLESLVACCILVGSGMVSCMASFLFLWVKHSIVLVFSLMLVARLDSPGNDEHERVHRKVFSFVSRITMYF